MVSLAVAVPVVNAVVDTVAVNVVFASFAVTVTTPNCHEVGAEPVDTQVRVSVP